MASPGTHPYEFSDEHPEWAAVITNSADKPVNQFKALALDVLIDATGIPPAIALDADLTANKIYRSAGVLITTKDI